jgi:hypothetical protein
VPPQTPAASSSALPPPRANQYSSNEIIDAGHHFFDGISHGLASIVEKAVSQWGLPNGYILGEEASGAFIGGLRYGEGTLYTRNAGDARVFWQGPSLGFDYGADGAHTMMLVYHLPQPGAIFDRFLGVAGSAYFVGGLGMTTLSSADGHMVVVPIRSGLTADRSQSWLSQIHGTPDLEPVLIAEPRDGIASTFQALACAYRGPCSGDWPTLKGSVGASVCRMPSASEEAGKWLLVEAGGQPRVAKLPLAAWLAFFFS